MQEPASLSSAADSDSALQSLIGQYVNVTTSVAASGAQPRSPLIYFGELGAVFPDAIVVYNMQNFGIVEGEVLIYKQSLVSVLPVEKPLSDEELLERERQQQEANA